MAPGQMVSAQLPAPAACDDRGETDSLADPQDRVRIFPSSLCGIHDTYLHGANLPRKRAPAQERSPSQVFSCSLALLRCVALAAQLASRVRASWLGDPGSAV